MRLQLLRGTFDYPKGTISFVQYPVVRTYRWDQPPGINHTNTLVRPEVYDGSLTTTQITPFNFRRGSIQLLPGGVYLITTSTPTLFESGQIRLLLTGSADAGALSNFSIFPTGAYDPEGFYIESVTVNQDQGGADQPWVRNDAIFAVSRGYNGFDKVTYIGVGVKIEGVPSGDNHYLKMVQLEPADTSGLNTYPTPYSQVREVQTIIHPDRLNLSGNPAFSLNATDWNANNHGGDIERVADGDGWAGQVTIPSGADVNVKHTIESMVVGRRYTFSTHVYAPERNDVTFDVTGGELLASRSYAQSTTLRGDGGVHRNSPYKRIWCVFTATSPEVVINLNPTSLADTPDVLITETLVEEGVSLVDAIGEYFDGDTGDDYLWEQGGNPGATRSYFYQNRAERAAAVRRILQANVPMGIGIAEPQYAVLPISDDTLGMYEPYGSGVYGGYVYGG